MRFTSIVLSYSDSEQETELTMRPYDPNMRYAVRSIVGLDAEELIPKFAGRGLVSGNKHYEVSMRPRDIALRVVLNPLYRLNESVSDIRDVLYRLISPTRTGQIKLIFKYGSTAVAAITGMITKFEVAHFSQVPELQLTLNCVDPIFRSPTLIEMEPNELPASGPVSWTDEYSNAPHGFSFKVKLTAPLTTFIIQDKASSPDWRFALTPVGGMATNDEIWFSSEYGNKSLFINKAVGTDFHALNFVEPNPTWPLLFPGENVMHFLQIASFDWLEVNFYAAYWGL